VNRATARDHLLGDGSAVLRVNYWQGAPRGDLMSLIKRFATRENQARRKGAPIFRWRHLRLRAVAIFEKRFEDVPKVYRMHKLPKMRSYYIHDGRYIWPESGEPGKPVVYRRPDSGHS
jgi:hypothetical protein